METGDKIMASTAKENIIPDTGYDSSGERDCIYCENPGAYGVTSRVKDGLHLNVDVLPAGGGVACQKDPDRIKPWVYQGTSIGGISNYGPQKN